MVIPSVDTKSTTSIATTTTTVTTNNIHSNAATTVTSSTRSTTITAAITLKAQHKQPTQLPVVAGQQLQLQTTESTRTAGSTQIQPPPRQHPKKRKFDPAELDQHSEAHQHYQQQTAVEAGDILPAKNAAISNASGTLAFSASSLSTLKNCNITLYHNPPTTATSNAHNLMSTLPVLNSNNKSVPASTHFSSSSPATFSHYATTTKSAIDGPSTLFTIRTLQPIVVSTVASTTSHIAKTISPLSGNNNDARRDKGIIR